MDTNDYQDNKNEANYQNSINEAPKTQTNETRSSEVYHKMPFFYQPEPESIGLSVASMVLGIISLVLGCCLWPLTLICSLLAVIFAAISIHNHKGGRGMAIAGLVCGLIGLANVILIWVWVGVANLNWYDQWLD